MATTVYAVCYSDYDEHWTAGIFSGREKAEQYMGKMSRGRQQHGCWDIEEYELDNPKP